MNNHFMQKNFFVLLVIVLFPTPLVFAQNVNDHVSFSDNVSLQITYDNLAKISSKIDNLEIQINELNKNLLNHEIWSSGSNYLAMISGGIIGTAGALIGITQLLINRNKTKEETSKRKHVMEQIKRNLVDILDLAKTLQKISPNSEKLFDMRTWKLIRLRVKAISILLAGSMTLLDTKLVHRTLGYLNYMDERFDLAEKKYSMSYVFLVKHTESFLDKFFPEHKQERLSLLEQMEEQAKWFEQQQKEENEEMLKYYEEKYGPELFMDAESETEDDEESVE